MKGLQKGHNGAMDTAAKTIDSNLRIIRDDLLKELSIDKRLSMKKRIGNGSSKTSCQPDGGAWYYDDVLIAVFEAKKQGDIGNAIERWYKNEYVCRKINKDVSYVTFCCGEGAYENGTIGKTLHPISSTSSLPSVISSMPSFTLPVTVSQSFLRLSKKSDAETGVASIITIAKKLNTTAQLLIASFPHRNRMTALPRNTLSI